MTSIQWWRKGCHTKHCRIFLEFSRFCKSESPLNRRNLVRFYEWWPFSKTTTFRPPLYCKVKKGPYILTLWNLTMMDHTENYSNSIQGTYFILHRFYLHIFCDSFWNRKFFRLNWRLFFWVSNWISICSSSNAFMTRYFDSILFNFFALRTIIFRLFRLCTFLVPWIFFRWRRWRGFIITLNVQIFLSDMNHVIKWLYFINNSFFTINEHGPRRIRSSLLVYNNLTWIPRK